MEEAKNHRNDKTVIMLIGAKSDLADKREVIKETVEDFANEQQIKLSVEVSINKCRRVRRVMKGLRRHLRR